MSNEETSKKGLVHATLCDNPQKQVIENLPTTTGYNSESSFDSEDMLDIPLQPKPSSAMSTSELVITTSKCKRPNSLANSTTESSDGYESSTKSLSSREEKRKAKYIKAGEGIS